MTRTLFDDLLPSDRPLVRALLAAEVAFAEDWAYNDCDQVTLQLGCLMLYRLGHVEDSLDIWRAKRCCFDAAALIDVQLLCGGGMEATVEFLRVHAVEAYEYIQECRRVGDFHQTIKEHVDAFESNLREDLRGIP